ncbi:zinc-dependent metalloprotease [Lacinutrix sp. Bg11-31]|uniref:zinc-dependent metalloprotease n=1 Tax=Lacinutrix sp. Bg11-31 TaxID=2057808 RepID=UPI000C3160D0|nr:zinc-dependent metalloprotease [Lacinutrix sp. Bg11-31]AUC81454.1 zinc metalloprotease [Lacinutrix sp. Bg11-31]
MKSTTIFLVLITLIVSLSITAQNSSLDCNASEVNDIYFQQHPKSLNEYKQFNEYSKKFINNLKQNKLSRTTSYVIPVVVHVYGEVQGGLPVDYQTIVNTIAQVNEEFQGLNTDYNTVDAYFMGIRGSLDIEFKLATLDPDGNCTDGVVFHSVASGQANYNSTIVPNDAWDNYKYMNIYITNDLYANGYLFYNGVAWYPSTQMSDDNIARVVYNGIYLTGNTDSETASILTHEIGHFFNLIHTHEGDCGNLDQVMDTPAEILYSDIQNFCSQNVQCGNNVNYENYMGYKAYYGGCYKMFTQGQINRVIAALNHPTRQPLWQPSNLIATGVNIDCNLSVIDFTLENKVIIYPNPTNDSFNIMSNAFNGEDILINIYTILGQKVYQKEYKNAESSLTIENSIKSSGYYIVKVILKNGKQINIPLIKK